MSSTEIAVIISAAGFVLSLIGAVLAIGIAWGLMRGELRAVQASIQHSASSVEVQNLAARMGRIEGLFEYRLIEQGQGRHSS